MATPGRTARRTARRVHVIGGPGSGKSTFAEQVGRMIGAAVHHLDDVYRMSGGTSPPRDPDERWAIVQRILSERAWVTEGVHLGWTDPLLEGADMVVWLDTVGWKRASARITRRFTAGAATGIREQHGHRKVSRVGDYARHLRDLFGAVRETRAYYKGKRGTLGLPETRAATAIRLSRLKGPVAHCQRPGDVARVLEDLGRAR